MRLVTYNIRGGLGIDGCRALSRVGVVLAGIDADIVCLQEAHRRLPWSGFRSQAAYLGRRLGLAVVYGESFRVGIGGFGNAVLTRLPVVMHTVWPLENRGERARATMRFERRSLLEVVVSTPPGPLAVLTTHWSLDERDRLASSEQVAARVNGCGMPAVVAGDLNARPGSPEIARLAALTGLLDAGAESDLPTYPVDKPAARIDYIWLSPALCGHDVRVVNTPASDHLPMTAQLSYRR